MTPGRGQQVTVVADLLEFVFLFTVRTSSTLNMSVFSLGFQLRGRVS